MPLLSGAVSRKPGFLERIPQSVCLPRNGLHFAPIYVEDFPVYGADLNRMLYACGFHTSKTAS